MLDIPVPTLPTPEEAIARPFVSAMRHSIAMKERTIAERLIAAAARSAEIEAWISRQLLAGQLPSQILTALGQGGHADA